MIRSVGALNNIWKIPDLKKKVLYTLLILFVYRIGTHIPAPFIDREQLARMMENSRQGLGSSLFAVVDLFSGNAFRQMSVLALGIMPYISVSIILQLLAVVYPKLQKLQQEGALGQRKINRMTRQFTVVLALLQGFAMAIYLETNGLTYMNAGAERILFLFTTSIAMTAGTTFIMWLGERITDDGIGNGISLIIAVGIMASYPADAISIASQIKSGAVAPLWGIVTVILFVVSTVSIILIQDGTRRIPMQSAGRVVGRKQMRSSNNYLPLKVNTAGVIPVIFASAILAFPSFLSQVLPGGSQGGVGAAVGNFFSMNSPTNLYDALHLKMGGALYILKAVNAHVILYALLTGFFCYFYTAVTFNPDDIANNLKKSGSFIPGKRPGRPTSEYIDYVLTRVTTFGAVFLVVIAVLPIILQVSYSMPYQAGAFVGGTGLIIVIGVLLDTLKQVESQLLMRHYEGFTARRTSSRWR